MIATAMDITDTINYERYNIDVQRKRLEKIDSYLAKNPKDGYALRKKKLILETIESKSEQVYNLEQIEKILPPGEERPNPFKGLMIEWA